MHFESWKYVKMRLRQGFLPDPSGKLKALPRIVAAFLEPKRKVQQKRKNKKKEKAWKVVNNV